MPDNQQSPDDSQEASCWAHLLVWLEIVILLVLLAAIVIGFVAMALG